MHRCLLLETQLLSRANNVISKISTSITSAPPRYIDKTKILFKVFDEIKKKIIILYIIKYERASLKISIILDNFQMKVYVQVLSIELIGSVLLITSSNSMSQISPILYETDHYNRIESRSTSVNRAAPCNVGGSSQDRTY